MNRYVFSFLGLFLGLAMPAVASAQVSPASFSFNGRLTDTSDAPVTSSNVVFTVQIFNPGETCLLYEETQAVDLSTSGGYFSLSVGAGTRTGSDPGLVFFNIFKNPSALRACYTSAPNDQRKLRVIVSSVSGTPTNDLLSSLPIQSIPFALAADNANTVQGKTASDFINVNGSANLTQSNIENIFGNYSTLLNLISGSSTLYTKPAANGTLPLPSYATDPSSMAEGQLWYDTTADTLKYRTGSGSIALDGSTNLPAVGTPGTYTKVTTDAQGRVTTGSTLAESDIPTLSAAGKVSGSAISGTIGGATVINTTGAITTTGTITSGILSATSTQTRNIQIHDNDTNKLTLQTVTDLTGDLTWTLPNTNGSSGQFLTTNGSGTLSWSSPASAGITDLTGDITATGPGSAAATISTGAVSTAKLADDGVTFQKLQNISSARLLGRTTAAVGDVEELQVSSDLNLSSGILSLNTVPINKGGTNSTTPLNNNRIMVSSGGAIVEAPALTDGQILIGSSGAAPQAANLSAGTNISIVSSAGGITINSTAGSGTVTSVNGTTPINVVNTTTTPVISISQATTSTDGYLSSTDWNTFNNKLSAVTNSALPSGQIWVGNASNQATAVTLAGPVTVDSLGNTAIANSAVTYAKMQNMTSQRLLGRATAGSGSPEELQIGAGLTISGAYLNLMDTTDDDSFAALPCANGFLPYKAAGAWTCIEAIDTLTNSTLVKRDASGSFAGNQGTFNSLRLNNAGSFVTVGTPIGANYALTLPSDDGTPNQVLQTDGSGSLTWVTPSGSGDFKADGSVPMTGNLKLNGQWLSNDGGNEGLRVDNAGNIGVGVGSPLVKLEVAGSMILGDGAEACGGGSYAGAIRYNGSNLQFCNFSGWQTVGTAGTGVTVVNGTGPISVVNNTSTPDISISQASTTTDGYLSSGDWNAFNSKLSTVTGAALPSGQIWVGNGSNAATAVGMSGDVSISSAGATTIAASAITSAKISDGSVALADLANLASGSIIGRGTASTGVPESIAIGNGLTMTAANLGLMSCSASQVLVHDGTNWGCANVATGLGGSTIVKRDASSQITANGFRITNGGTATLINSSGMTYTLSLPSGIGSNGQILASNGSGSLVWVTDNAGGDFMANGSVPMTNQLIAATASSTAPAYTFSGDLDTGIYNPSMNQIGFSSGGTDALRITGASSATINAGLFRASPGTASNPGHSFSNDINSGMYSLSTSNIGFVTNSVNRMTIDASGNIGIGMTNPSATLDVLGPIRFTGDVTPCTTALWGALQVDTNNMIKVCDGGSFTWVSPVSPDVNANAGTAASPSISFSGDTNTGLFSAAADILGFTTNGTERMRIDSAGNVGIGSTSAGYMFQIDRTPSASGGAKVMIRSQGGTLGTAGGDIEISAGTGAGTGGDGGNVYINGGAGPDLSGNIELKPGAGASAGKVLIGINGTSFFRMGGCKFNVGLSSTWSANQICTNVPTTGVALNCTSDHASISPTQIVTCVPSALHNIKCGVSSGTLTTSNITCMWLVP